MRKRRVSEEEKGSGCVLHGGVVVHMLGTVSG